MNHSQPNASRNASAGICRKKDSPLIWLACAAIAARFSPTKSRTSTVVVISAAGDPMSKSSGSGMSASSPSSAARARMRPMMWSRLRVLSYTRGVPASSAARLPTWCTWMWSGCP